MMRGYVGMQDINTKGVSGMRAKRGSMEDFVKADCTECLGDGYVTYMDDVSATEEVCPKCDGEGTKTYYIDEEYEVADATLYQIGDY